MTTDNQSFGYRLEELERRWAVEADRTVLLKLAEEYGNHGRWRDAVRVLQEGLAKRPEHVAARVVLGRSHLRSGYPADACTALEQVVLADPMHLVANKLLVEAYLDTGQVQRARDRLDLYSLLAGSDPDIERLESEVIAGEQGHSRPPAIPQPDSVVGDSGTVFGVSASPGDSSPPLFDLSQLAPAGRVDSVTAEIFGARQQDPFVALLGDLPREGAQASPGVGALFALSATGWTLESGARPVDRPAGPSLDTGEPGFATPPPIGEMAAFGEAGIDETAAADDLYSAGDADDESPATVTLGRLYLAQGHPARAADVFIRVLREEPQNSEARDGLVEARLASGWTLTAQDLLQSATGADDTPGRREMLVKYLERIAGSGVRSSGIQTN